MASAPGRSSRRRKVASAFSTAGGGFTFEASVGGYVAAAMLAGASPFGSEIGVPELIVFQASAHGHALDDLVIHGKNLHPALGPRVLACSVKAYNMMPNGELLEEFVAYAWHEMLREGFRANHDRLGLICGQASERNLQALGRLITAARRDSDVGLAARINIPRAFNDIQRALWRTASCPADIADQYDVDRDTSAARLLRHLIPRHFDLESSDSNDAAQAQAWCLAALVPSQAGSAGSLMRDVRTLADEASNTGGSLDFAACVAGASPGLLLHTRPDVASAWRPVAEYTQRQIDAVRDVLGAELQLPRTEAWETVEDQTRGQPIAMLTGPSGCGKSAIAKRWIEAEPDAHTLWLAALDLEDGLTGLRARFGLPVSLIWLLEHLPGSLRVVVDGLDRTFAPAAFVATAELARVATGSQGQIHLLAPCQDMALPQVMQQLNSAGGRGGTSVTVGDLDDSDLDLLFSEQPHLLMLTVAGQLHDVLRRPKLLDLILQAAELGVPGLEQLRDETDVASLWWRYIAVVGADRHARSAMLQQLAVRQADEMRPVTPITRFGPGSVGSVAGLQTDGVLAPGDDRLAFAHDLFGDWARLKHLQAEGESVISFLPGKELLPPWHRAVRLLALSTLRDGATVWEQMRNALDAHGRQLLGDLFVDAIVFADNASELFDELWNRLTSDGGRLLRRLLTRFLQVATFPDPRGAEMFSDNPFMEVHFAAQRRIPIFPLWPAVLAALAAHVDQSMDLSPVLVARVADLWLRATPDDWPLRPDAAVLGLAAARHAFETHSRGYYLDAQQASELYRAALAAAAVQTDQIVNLLVQALEVPANELEDENQDQISDSAEPFVLPSRSPQTTEASAALEGLGREAIEPVRGGAADPRHTGTADAFASRTLSGTPQLDRHERDQLRASILNGDSLAPLIRSDPNRAAQLLRAAVLDPLARYRSELIDYSGSLHITDAPRWALPIPELGPFQLFLSLAPDTAVRLIIDIVEQATRDWSEAVEPEVRQPVFAVMLGDRPMDLIGDTTVMHWNRGEGNPPTVLTSMLMAMEAWIYRRLDAQEDLSPTFYLLLTSQSAAIWGLATDIAAYRPALLEGPLTPLITSGNLVTANRAYRSNSRSHLVDTLLDPASADRSRRWHEMVHRTTTLLEIVMRSVPTGGALVDGLLNARSHWETGDPERLSHLLAQTDVANYQLQQLSPGIMGWGYVPPPHLWVQVEEGNEQARATYLWIGLPADLRQILDRGEQLQHQQLDSYWAMVQGPLQREMPAELTLGEVRARADVECGLAAVFVMCGITWLENNTEAWTWSRSHLLAPFSDPPPTHQLDSPDAPDTDSWDAFCADALPTLWAASPQNVELRSAIRALVTNPHYATVQRLMLRTSKINTLGEDLKRLEYLALVWSRWLAHSSDERTLPRREPDTSIDAASSALAAATSAVMVAFDAGDLSAERPRLADWIGSTPAGLPDPRHSRGPAEIDADYLLAAFAHVIVLDTGLGIQEFESRLLFAEDLAALIGEGLSQSEGDRVHGNPRAYEKTALDRLGSITVVAPPARRSAIWRPLLAPGARAGFWVRLFLYSVWRGTSEVRFEQAAGLVREMIEYAEEAPNWSRDLGHRIDISLGLVGLDRLGGGYLATASILIAAGEAWTRWVSTELEDPWYATRALGFFGTAEADPVLESMLVRLAELEPRRPGSVRSRYDEELGEMLAELHTRRPEVFVAPSPIGRSSRYLLSQLAERGSALGLELVARLASRS